MDMQQGNKAVHGWMATAGALLLLSAACALPAQQKSPELTPPPAFAPPANSGPQLKQSPTNILRNFEPPADEEYRLGKGDEITIDFPGRPEMLAKLVIGPDGRITLPLAGDLLIAEQTRVEAAKTIQSALESYYSNLSVMIIVTKYTSNRVLLLGAVEHPGTISFDGAPTLLEAITRGGLESSVTNKASQIPEQCAIYRGNDQIVWVNLREMVETGNASANLRLRRNDVIYVPSLSERFISVLGEVAHPGAIPLRYNTTVAALLAEAGGITDKAGNNPHVQIVNPASGTSRIISYKDILRPEKALEVRLNPGDILYVPKSGFYKATYVLERLSPLVSVASMAFYAGAL